VFAGNQLTSVTIGANVSMSQSNSYKIDIYKLYFQTDNIDGFGTAYENSGRQAGTYVLRNGFWAKQ
jgi:hypothetical protein